MQLYVTCRHHPSSKSFLVGRSPNGSILLGPVAGCASPNADVMNLPPNEKPGPNFDELYGICPLDTRVIPTFSEVAGFDVII